MASQPAPRSPTHTHNSTSSYSLVQSLDSLSLSTGSFDLVSNPSSASHQQIPSTTASQRSQSSHSRQSSGSIISAPGSYGHEEAGRERGMSISEDDEVVLIPRSLASSVIGGSDVGRTSGTGMTLSDQIRESLSRAGSAARGTAPTPKLKAESMGGDSSASEASFIGVPADYTSASENSFVGLSASELRSIDQFAKIKAKTLVRKRRQKAAWRAQADGDPAAFQDTVGVSQDDPEVQEEYERFKREKVKRKLRAKRAAQKERSDVSASQAGSVLGQSIAGDVNKGKGKGKAKGRGKGKAMNGISSTSEPRPVPTIYNISGTPRTIDQSALNLLTGGRAPAPVPPTSLAPPAPELQQASLQKLHLLDLLNNGSTSGSSAGGSRAEDEDSSSEEEEAEGDEEGSDVLTDLGTPEVYTDLTGSTSRSTRTPSSAASSGVGSQRRRRAEGSIMSADDAKSSIDDFMMNPRQRLSREETLRFWQSLCYELGLADLDDDLPDLPTSSSTASYTDSASSRSTTPTQISRPMPQNLFAARSLLKSEGHVNIADYFEARKADQEAAAAAQAAAAGEEGTKVESAAEDGPGKYAHLVQGSAGSMKKYTRSSGRFVQLDWVKAEAMQPLLRDFGFKRGRERRGEMA